MSTVLYIDDEPSVGQVLEDSLRSLGHRPLRATTLGEGIQAVGRETVDLIISDHRVADGTGIELLEALRRQGYDIPVIMTSPYSNVENAVLSMRHGAVDYLTKPLRAEAVRIAVNKAIELDRMRRVNEGYQRELCTLRRSQTIVGRSAALQRILEIVDSVAPTRATILLEGESGTGKELVARAIHERSPRQAEPFVTVNCAALPEGLVESTLFGHERGAFTGATARATGAFERAHRGTLLLDEISEMRLDLQAKLLRAIQEQEFERVGGHATVKVDVRIVATTNRDLGVEVQAGRFRGDLFYRLNVVPIHVPSLRDRLEDVPDLAAHFVSIFAAQLGLRRPAISAEAIEWLEQQPWPGNIRELANAIERAVILCRSGRLTLESFAVRRWDPVRPAAGGPSPIALPTPEDATFNLHVLERVTIRRALEATRGHRARAAQLLGICERTLRNKLKR